MLVMSFLWMRCQQRTHVIYSSAVKLFIQLCQVQKHENCYKMQKIHEIQNKWAKTRIFNDKSGTSFKNKMHRTKLTAWWHEGELWHYPPDARCTQGRSIKVGGGVHYWASCCLWMDQSLFPTKIYVKYIVSFGCSASVRRARHQKQRVYNTSAWTVHMPLQHVKNTDNEKHKYIHHKTQDIQKCTHTWSWVLFMRSYFPGQEVGDKSPNHLGCWH